MAENVQNNPVAYGSAKVALDNACVNGNAEVSYI